HHHADHSVVSSLHFAYTASSSTRVCLLSLHDALPIFIYLFPYLPKIGRVIPSPLVCILVLTAIAMYFGIDIRTVGDMGELPDTLDRKSTRLNSSHVKISYAVFCLKKKTIGSRTALHRC